MPSAASGLFLIDMFCKPFYKILEKMPFVMILFLFILYGAIAYFLLRSAYMAENQHPY